MSSSQFEDVTDVVGLSWSGGSWGSAWGDFNGDGWPDLWPGGHRPTPDLFQNEGGLTFENVSASVLDVASVVDSHGAAWGDFDSDGDMNLVVLTGACEGTCANDNLFFVNDQGPPCTAMLCKQKVGLEYPLSSGRTPLWFDWNNDGLLDLMEGTWTTTPIAPNELQKPSLFEQQSDGTFDDVTDSVGFETDQGRCSHAQLSDLTGDGRMELICASTVLSRVYDVSQVPFVDLLDLLNLPYVFSRDMAIADFNGDLLPDIHLVRGPQTSSLLFLNNGAGFDDHTAQSGLALDPQVRGNCIGTVAGDFDNDGDVDLYDVCSEHEENGNTANFLYENDGTGIFTVVLDAGGAAGYEGVGQGETASTVDFDRDGDLDLFVPTQWAHQFLLNTGNENNWLEIDLVGRISNRDGIGARVHITAGGTTQLREQTGGMHNKSQNHSRLHVGLGLNTEVDQIDVFWPSGRTQTLIGPLSVNEIRTLDEATGCIAEMGSVATNQSGPGAWHTVTLHNTYQNPVVIMQPASFNGGQPTTIRIRNVQANQFEFQMQEWVYLDGVHLEETNGYMVVEAGDHLLPDGTRLVAQTATAVNDQWTEVLFSAFEEPPVILSQIQTNNESDPAVTRQRPSNLRDVRLKLQEEEASAQDHDQETIGIVAIEAGMGTNGPLAFEARHISQPLTHEWTTETFGQQFTMPPVLVAAIQSHHGPDTTTLRYRNLTSMAGELKLEEEQSANPETLHHNAEEIGLILSDAGLLCLQ